MFTNIFKNTINHSLTYYKSSMKFTLITTLYNEIMTLRGDMDTLRGNLIIVKTKKADKELENWGCKSLESEITARKTSETTVITAVNDLYTP